MHTAYAKVYCVYPGIVTSEPDISKHTTTIRNSIDGLKLLTDEEATTAIMNSPNTFDTHLTLPPTLPQNCINSMIQNDTIKAVNDVYTSGYVDLFSNS